MSLFSTHLLSWSALLLVLDALLWHLAPFKHRAPRVVQSTLPPVSSAPVCPTAMT